MTTWHQSVACLDADPEVFFRTDAASVAEAKAICAGCDARHPCLTETMTIERGLSHHSRDGIHGGLTPLERARLDGLDTPPARRHHNACPPNCADCHRPMRGRHTPHDGRVVYGGYGLCSGCYTRARRTA